MKKIAFCLCILSLASCGVQRIPLNELDTLEPVTLYETTSDYLNKKPMRVDAGILVKDQSTQHITIKGIFNRKTGEKIDKAISAWAMEYRDNNYFNLGYSTDLNHWNSYVKFDIEGKYSAVIIDDNSPYVLKTTSNSYGGGIAGSLIAESLKWNKNWKDKNGDKKKILFIDTQDISPKKLNRNASSHGDYLTRKQFEKLMEETNTSLSEEKIKDIEFEKVIEIIEAANKTKSEAEINAQL
ncbi:hypothetical protein [Salegentibacter salegens]|uniref:Lipoprotein n=1 Tax=Salegentibacter salegens TaxID=143223 RepID=A0A1M7JAK5_9FLAO|nr:hypothetical protein [Salegentibacter salegens]PRX47309.1 hypothetical protein LY58_01399 [Salegentibacter salegens]SHM49517.1 hypothetical protein SAMN05878281_0866 [Salegentibacter salegens]